MSEGEWFLIFPSSDCFLCHHPEDEFNLGRLYNLQIFSVHYLCVLTSVSRNGNKHEGLFGFLVDDITNCYDISFPRICEFCEQSGATLKCGGCTLTYHLPCALKNGVLVQMCRKYKSYCSNCQIKRPTKIPKELKDALCPICYSPFDEDEKPYWPQCCKPRELFHINCMKRHAFSLRCEMKCPLCLNARSFRMSVRCAGVYIPDGYPSWLATVEEDTTMATVEVDTIIALAEHCEARFCIQNQNFGESVDCLLCKIKKAHVDCTFHSLFVCAECTQRLWEETVTVPLKSSKRATRREQTKDRFESNLPPMVNIVTKEKLMNELNEKFPWLSYIIKKDIAKGNKSMKNFLRWILWRAALYRQERRYYWVNILTLEEKKFIRDKIKECAKKQKPQEGSTSLEGNVDEEN